MCHKARTSRSLGRPGTKLSVSRGAQRQDYRLCTTLRVPGTMATSCWSRKSGSVAWNDTVGPSGKGDCATVPVQVELAVLD